MGSRVHHTGCSSRSKRSVIVKYPPSSADVWVNCTGSAALVASNPLPKVNSDDKPNSRLEGKAFDWLVSETCEHSIDEYLGKLSPDGVLVDEAMIEAVGDYLGLIGPNASIEHQVDLSFFKRGQIGRIDALIVDVECTEIHIVDAKYGHTYVDEFENYQLAIYLKGVLEQNPEYEGYTFKLSIFQPRCYSVGGTFRTWEPTLSELNEVIRKVKKSVLLSENKNTTCNVGNHCRKCDARHACTALQKATYQGFEYVDDTVPLVLSDENLAMEYKLLKRFESQVKARLSGIQQDVTSRMQKGLSVPGLSGARGEGRTRWKKDANVQEVIDIAELLEVKDITRPVQLITPNQLSKKGVDSTVISDYIETPQSDFKITEINQKQLRKTFNIK